jgi:hypothetical protein
MSTTTTTSNGGATPFQQWQSFYPSGAPGAMPPYAFDPTVTAINDTERNLTAEISGIEKSINQSTLGLRDAVERGNTLIGNSIERTSGDAKSTMEKACSQVGSAVERNGGQLGSAVERNSGNIMTAIEKVAGEQRLTTTVTDAATRQANADSARDLAIAIERTGAAGVNAAMQQGETLLGSIERNAGESRVTTVTQSGQLDAKLTDVRHSVLNTSNSNTSEILAANTQNVNVLSKAVFDSAMETRAVLASGFSNAMSEQLKSNVSAGEHYASLLLEQQKVKEYLSAKGDNQFAMTQMEVMKCKADLAAQSAGQFAANQLENQKLGSMISAQLAEAKYDALKNNNDLSKQLAECCCEIKEKNDKLDRERLRDELVNANTDKAILATHPYGGYGGHGIFPGVGFPGGYGGYGHGYGGYGGYGPGVGYGNNVHIHSQDRENSPGPIRGGGHGGPP